MIINIADMMDNNSNQPLAVMVLMLKYLLNSYYVFISCFCVCLFPLLSWVSFDTHLVYILLQKLVVALTVDDYGQNTIQQCYNDQI